MRTFLHERLLASHGLICSVGPRAVYAHKRFWDVFLVQSIVLSGGRVTQFYVYNFKVETNTVSDVSQSLVLGAQQNDQWDCDLFVFLNIFYLTLLWLFVHWQLCAWTTLSCLKWGIQYIFALLHWLYEQPLSVMRLVAFQVQQCLFIGQERLFVSGGSVTWGLFFYWRSSCTHKCPVPDFCINPSALNEVHSMKRAV